jgi:hypothetical protein
MLFRKAALGLIVGGLATVLTAGMAFAQAGGGGGGGFGGRGPRMNPMDFVKQQLNVTDEEWTVLQPKVEKVLTMSRELRFGGMMGMMRGRRGGQGGGEPAENAPAAPAQVSDLQEKTSDLRTTLDNKDSDPKDIAQKVAALREARKEAQEELTKAQAELKKLLTPRQEAQLVLMGILD